MNIGIINQPTKNRGDEAAHKSFIRLLSDKLVTANITVYFINEDEDTIDKMKVESTRIRYINISSFSKGCTWAMEKSLVTNIKFIGKLHPNINLLKKYLVKEDYIICAPGGISMGGFQNWAHIYQLNLALTLQKKLAYYSRSFGPFKNENKKDRLFNEISYSILRNLDFLSIRDKKTFQIADSLNLSYIKSIDSAFLDRPDTKLPVGLNFIQNLGNFMVFVPNSLIWHPFYRNRNSEKIDQYYTSILEYVLANKLFSEVVMLPQLFNDKNNNDYQYFKSLINNLDDRFKNKIHVVDDTHSSDIQQVIISRSNLVIGARYHSSVFAINNNIPLISLSYEHKILGLMDQLGYDQNVVDIANIGTKTFDINNSLAQVYSKIDTYRKFSTNRDQASHLAIDCMESLISRIEEV